MITKHTRMPDSASLTRFDNCVVVKYKQIWTALQFHYTLPNNISYFKEMYSLQQQKIQKKTKTQAKANKQFAFFSSKLVLLSAESTSPLSLSLSHTYNTEPCCQ